MTSDSAPADATKVAEAELSERCKNCGAAPRFDPTVRALHCESCGHIEPLGFDRVDVATYEIPLDAGLASLRDGGDEPVDKAGHCDNCGATIDFGKINITSHCAFCGNQSVILLKDYRRAIKPELVVPFVHSQDAAQQAFRVWLGRLWFRPSKLKRLAKTESITGCYLPYWTFDAHVDSSWTADAGYYYWETETYSTYQNGEWVTETRQVRKVRWVPASGARSDNYDDVLVPASHRIDALGQRPDAVATFDTSVATPFDPDYVAGFVAEEYQTDLPEALADGLEQIKATQRARCAGDIPGDTHRFLRVENQFFEQTFKLMLLPIWLFTYDYRGKPYRFVMNGQSGAVWGRAPWSWVKLTLLILFILAVVGGGLYLYQRGQDG